MSLIILGCSKRAGHPVPLWRVVFRRNSVSLCFQVPMWSMAGERCWRWQLGTSSNRTSGVTWWRRGCWPVHRDASRAGLSFPECSDCAGITWPKQYVPSHRAFFSTIAALLVYIVCVMQTHTSCSLYHFSASPCVRCVGFVNIHSLVCVFNCVWSFFCPVRDSVCWSARGHEGGSK